MSIFRLILLKKKWFIINSNIELLKYYVHQRIGFFVSVFPLLTKEKERQFIDKIKIKQRVFNLYHLCG